MRPRGFRLSLVLVFLASGCTDEELAELGFEHYIVGLEAEPSEVAAEVQALADSIGFEPLHVYDKATQGFSVRLPDGLVEAAARGADGHGHSPALRRAFALLLRALLHGALRKALAT